ncbi:MAG: dienelactone hydrolase family protein [Alphaproteobacteria bacterium]
MSRPNRTPGLVVLLVFLALGACAVPRFAPPDGARPVTLASRDFRFVDEPLAGRAVPARAVGAALVRPDPATAGPPPWPAVVILHASTGQGSQDWHYAAAFREMGLAVLAVDSFTARGVRSTHRDHTAVSETAMLADAYAALEHLRAEPDIDGSRIAVVGFSKGGIAALYAANDRLAKAMATDGGRFAAHVAYYPWCGLRLRDPRPTGAPVLIHSGGRDRIAPAALCAETVAAMRTAAPRTTVTHRIHARAGHAFDHPLIQIFQELPVRYALPVHCRIDEVAPARFVERHSGLEVTGATIKRVLAECSEDGGEVVADRAAADSALAETSAFLRRHLRLP